MIDQPMHSSQQVALSLDPDQEACSDTPCDRQDLLAALLKSGRGQPGWLYAIAHCDELHAVLKQASVRRLTRA